MRQSILTALAVVVVGVLFVRQQRQQSEIDRLQAELATLRGADVDEFPATRSGDAGAERAVGLARPSELESPTPRARSASTGAGNGAPSAHEALVEALSSEDPAVRARVRELVDELAAERRDERRERRQERWEERTLERIDLLAERVSLTRNEQDALYAILATMRDRTGELLREGRQSGEPGRVRDRVRQVREEANAEVRQLLDDEQYAAYEQLRVEDRARRRGRR